MSMRTRTVRVHQVPEHVTPAKEHKFLTHLQDCAYTERPRFVLDCSRIARMDRATILLLLSSLEQVMKCNGDVRLACLSTEAEAKLRVSTVDRLFESYTTVEKAVDSFAQRATSIAPYSSECEMFDDGAKHAA